MYFVFRTEIVATNTLVGPNEKVGSLHCIWGACKSDKDELIVADKNNNRLIRMAKNGDYIGTVASSKSLNSPRCVAFSHKGEIIISEPRENCVKILDRTTGETTIITQANGRNFRTPEGIAINSEGLIFVCDAGNERIVMLDRDGTFEISESGSGKVQKTHYENAVFDKEDNIFVTDTIGSRIHVFSKDGNFVRCIGQELSKEHSFIECWGIAIYEQYMVVSDFYDDKVHVLTTAGEHICCVGGFDHPSGLVHDRNGIFYVCDTFKHRIVELELRLEPTVSLTVGTDPRKSDVRRKSTPQENTDTS